MPRIVIKLMLSDFPEKLQVVNGKGQCFNDHPAAIRLPHLSWIVEHGH